MRELHLPSPGHSHYDNASGRRRREQPFMAGYGGPPRMARFLSSVWLNLQACLGIMSLSKQPLRPFPKTSRHCVGTPESTWPTEYRGPAPSGSIVRRPYAHFR